MSVDIPSDYLPLISQLVSQGRYKTEDEVVAEGLRLISVKEKLHEDVAQGVAELDAGQRVPAEDVYQAARDRVRKVAEQ